MPHYLIRVDGKEYDITLEYRAERHDVKVNGRDVHVMSHKLGETRSLLLIDGKAHEIDVRSDGYHGSETVFMKGMEIPVEIEDYNLAQMRKTAGISSGPTIEKTLKAPMPGLLLEVKVTPGDTVTKGQPLLVVEAMKMENIIKAKADATVKVVHISGGASIEKGDKLLEFE
ncbi:MAG: biotin/lipoyl-containing protein [candidate division Zixibacteria bacterium]|nr:biotin/lipoyl-containing protein [candidate division Zixibacteria bacterium]